MDLKNCQMVRMLPTWMQDDEANIALSSVVDEIAAQIDAAARLLSVWDKIAELPEDVLDELAWALDISWWDSEAPIETKRALVRDSDYVHSKLGTVAAMESVAQAYLGDGEVIEWFDYGGKPHNFKIATGNLRLLHDNQERLLDRLMKAKRHSSKLESILVLLTGNVPLCSGLCFREAGYQSIYSQRRAAFALCGFGFNDVQTTEVCMVPVEQVGTPGRIGFGYRLSSRIEVNALPQWRCPAAMRAGFSFYAADRIAVDMIPAFAGERKEQ